MKQYKNLLLGETPIKHAPNIQLTNGENCIPQHYLQFQHTLESVDRIVADINYCDRYAIFACEDVNGLYIQIGIIGYDNYKSIKQQSQQKIVYGRKWRVEPELPTSEIIQTVFLALKTAREHEVRELFCVFNKGKKSTPFNNHHDLPLMAQNAELFKSELSCNTQLGDAKSINSVLSNIRYDSADLSLQNVQSLTNGAYLIEIGINLSSDSQLPELKSQTINLILPTLDENNLYFELMDAFLNLSDRHVEENFTYQNFARFSRNNSLLAIGELSTQLRQRGITEKTSGFNQAVQANNYETDKTRVPNIGKGLASQKARAQLSNFGLLSGLLPV